MLIADFNPAPAGLTPWLECACWLGAFVLILGGCYKMFWGGKHHSKSSGGKRAPSDPQRRFNYDLSEERHEDILLRLEKHDEEIASIQKDRAKSLGYINKRFERVLIGLERIGVKMGIEMPADDSGGEQ